MSIQGLCGRDNWIIASATRTNTTISSVAVGACVTCTCKQFRMFPVPSCSLAEANVRPCLGTLQSLGAQAQTHGCLWFKPKYLAVSQSGWSMARCPPRHEGAAIGKGQGRQIEPVTVSTATAGFTKALLLVHPVGGCSCKRTYEHHDTDSHDSYTGMGITLSSCPANPPALANIPEPLQPDQQLTLLARLIYSWICLRS